MKKLDVDYIDLYILHQPYGDVVWAYKALEEAQTEGKINLLALAIKMQSF